MVDIIWILILPFILITVEFARVVRYINKIKIIDESLNRRAIELEYIEYLTSHSLSSGQSIETDFTEYLNRLKEKLTWTYHSLWRLDEENQVVIIRFTGNLPDWYMDELSTKMLIKMGDASIGRAVATKQPVTINTTSGDPRFTTATSFSSRAGYRSLSCYPLVGKLKTHGGFCTYSEYENIFRLHDIKFLLTCANIFAIVLEHKLLDSYVGKLPNRQK